jgi:hypothetical protein
MTISKARILADTIADGGILSDGAIEAAEISNVTATAAEINILDGATVTTTELNTLDGITATTAELNYLSGTTSAVQTQLDTLTTDLGNVNTDLVNDTTPQLGGTLDTNGNDVTFADNVKAVFGAGSDLEIYHDGSNSYIVDNGTGDLNIRGSDTLRLQNATGTNYLYGTTGGQVVLYHNGSNRLSTTSTGVSVTGTVSATSFAGDGANLTGIEAGIGYDQSWGNFTGSRSENTNYTNSTGKPIMVNVESATASAGSADITYIDATVDGATFTIAYHIQDDENYTARSRCAGNFIVPAGSTYSVNISGNSISTWHELR